MNHPDLVFSQHLRRIKSAARHIIRPLHDDLKHQSALLGPIDVHHDFKPFQQLLFEFIRDELQLRNLLDLAVVGIDDIGTKRFDPESVTQRLYDYHERNAVLVVMTKEAHKHWHSINGKDPEPDWFIFR